MTSRTIVRTEASSRTSHTTGMAAPPTARISLTTACARSGTRSTTATRAPSAAKSMATWRAIPRPAPVITMLLPSNGPVFMVATMSSPCEGRRPSRAAVEDGYRVDLHQERMAVAHEGGGEPGHLHGGAGRELGHEEPGVDLVHRAVVRDVGQVDRGLDHVAEGAAPRLDDRAHVVEHLARLDPDVARADHVAVEVDRELAGDVQGVADPHSLGERPLRGEDPGAGDDLAGHPVRTRRAGEPPGASPATWRSAASPRAPRPRRPRPRDWPPPSDTSRSRTPRRG